MVSQAIGRLFHTPVVLIPANTAFCWNPKLFNVTVSRTTQLAVLIAGASRARLAEQPVVDFHAALVHMEW
eukprot:11197679-Lingulodinium_polyedra.AAC.1